MTPLYKASEGGHLQVVELLLSKDAEVDSRDEVSTYNNVMYCVTHMEIFGCNNLTMLLQG